MPRPDRGMAQRYAAKKRKKRPPTSRGLIPRTEPASQPLGNLCPAVETPPRVDASPMVPATSQNPAYRPRVSSRRPFSSYADEYRYVLFDLRRVVMVAGSLLLALIVLSFFIR